MKTIVNIIGLTYIHLFFQFAFLGIGFAIGMDRFDSMNSASFFENSINFIGSVLMLPIALPMIELYPKGEIPFPLEHLPFLLNSLLWAILMLYGWRKWKKYLQSKQQKSAV